MLGFEALTCMQRTRNSAAALVHDLPPELLAKLRYNSRAADVVRRGGCRAMLEFCRTL